MPARAWRVAAALLIAVAVGVQLLEMSGRWDLTFQDANDEAAIVAIVLCVGLALTSTAALTTALRLTRQRAPLPTTRFAISRERVARPLLNCRSSSPPLPLRV